MKVIHDNLFSQIISIENIFDSWNGFKKGKRKKADVQEFELHLEDGLFALHNELKSKTYKHSHYTSFFINDPKRRHIHKACVRDRIVHHAIYRILYPIFDKGFIHDSYSCRNEKGTHRAITRLESFVRKVSKNYSQPCYYLKCDVRKFFDSIDHDVLIGLIKKKASDKETIALIQNILESFDKPRERERERGTACPPNRKGLPLGNLTSQLFANIYLNELDCFVKQGLRERYYLRYCDDFLILGNDPKYLANLIKPIERFLDEKLRLSLHPNKVTIGKLNQGIDFLGYVVLPHYKVLRTKTKKRMFKKLKKKKKEYRAGEIFEDDVDRSVQSYLGLLSHGQNYIIENRVRRVIYDIAIENYAKIREWVS